MKKVTLLCRQADRDASLDALQTLGVLHLVPVSPPRSADLDQAGGRLRRTRSVLQALESYARPDQGDRTAHAAAPGAEQVVGDVLELLEKRRERRENLAALKREYAAQEPFGQFDPREIRALAARGVFVRLYRVTGRKPVVPPAGTTARIIRRDARGTCVVVAGNAPFEFEGEEFPAPERSLAEVGAEAGRVEAALRDIEARLGELSRHAGLIRARLAALTDEVRYLEASAGMGAGSGVAYLQGFCPADGIERLRRAASEHGWGLVVDEPGAEDVVPTLIRNPAWVRPIRSLFRMLDILPGYREIDIRPAFMLFFTLFFAILVGDAGYGLVFLLLVPVLRAKLGAKAREPLRLLLILSIATVAWGALTGVWFGVEPLPALLRRAEFPWMKDERNMIVFSFLVGAVHLTVAHAWRALQTVNSTRALAQAGWIMITWMMFFVARYLILGMPLPSPALALGGAGIALLILFMTPLKRLKTEWQEHVMLPFSVIGDFSDVVSYVRLFAVGSAGLAVAAAVNDLALGPEGVRSAGDAVKAALILAVGHIGNIVLCLMSVLVHGVRLNTLEFSGHIGLEWTGLRYRPFARGEAGGVETA
ncbi:MAG: hypothetical protein FJ225_08185 [Lentisphaerae bacterium]|nr:hypothetical protein [Lentisphaerota bacterium]